MLLLLALWGCADKDTGNPAGGDDSEAPEPPEEICDDAGVWPYTGGFTDATGSWGLSEVRGGRMSAADLDGDGYPDLIVSDVTSHTRDDFAAGERYHYVLFNREGVGGGRTFVDGTQESGLFAPRDGGDAGRAAQIHVFGDVDNDGDTDVFSGSFYDGNASDTDPGDRSELMLSNGDGTFTMAAQSDIHVDDGYATAGASFTDANGDGLLDLWVVGWYERYGYLYAEQDRLYLGQGDGTFRDETEDAGLEMKRGFNTGDWEDGAARRPAFGATACDLNGDTWPDLLASNYGRSWNQQWMNDGAALFTDTSMESGFAADDNLDYSDNQYYRCYCEVYGCDPDPGAASLADCETYAAYWAPGWDDQPHRLAGNSFSTACGDVDNDGDNDLLTSEIVHWHIGQSSDPSELLLNDGAGAFSRPGNDSNGLARTWPSSSWNAGDLYTAFADLDLDGWKDVLVASSDYEDTRLFAWRQVAPGQFEEVGETVGLDHPWPAGLVVADFDLDGDLDVVTGSSYARGGSPWTEREVHLYENQLSGGNHLRLTLEGEAANRAGVGARVEVRAGDLVQTYEVSGGYGHFGMHQDLALTIGLGEACSADEIVVTWPGGEVDTYSGVLANYAVVLGQGGAVEYP